MAISKQLDKLLTAGKIKYKPLVHRKVFTAFDATQTQKLKTSQVVKAVLTKGKTSLYLAALPAGSNCDFKALSKLAKDKLSMAKDKDITGKLKTKIGLLAPFGSLYKLPLFVDKKLIRNKTLNLPAGSYTDSIEIKTKDYLKLENPTLGSFSKKR